MNLVKFILVLLTVGLVSGCFDEDEPKPAVATSTPVSTPIADRKPTVLAPTANAQFNPTKAGYELIKRQEFEKRKKYI